MTVVVCVLCLLVPAPKVAPVPPIPVNLDAYYQLLAWEGQMAAQDALFAYLASLPVMRPETPPRPAQAVSGGSTGACGGATNGADRYIARESGGNPAIVNASSGAYGCFQVLPSTWASSCSDLGPEVGSSPSTQAACASRLPLSAWGG